MSMWTGVLTMVWTLAKITNKKWLWDESFEVFHEDRRQAFFSQVKHQRLWNRKFLCPCKFRKLYPDADHFRKLSSDVHLVGHMSEYLTGVFSVFYCVCQLAFSFWFLERDQNYRGKCGKRSICLDQCSSYFAHIFIDINCFPANADFSAFSQSSAVRPTSCVFLQSQQSGAKHFVQSRSHFWRLIPSLTRLIIFLRKSSGILQGRATIDRVAFCNKAAWQCLTVRTKRSFRKLCEAKSIVMNHSREHAKDWELFPYWDHGGGTRPPKATDWMDRKSPGSNNNAISAPFPQQFHPHFTATLRKGPQNLSSGNRKVGNWAGVMTVIELSVFLVPSPLLFIERLIPERQHCCCLSPRRPANFQIAGVLVSFGWFVTENTFVSLQPNNHAVRHGTCGRAAPRQQTIHSLRFLHRIEACFLWVAYRCRLNGL